MVTQQLGHTIPQVCKKVSLQTVFIVSVVLEISVIVELVTSHSPWREKAVAVKTETQSASYPALWKFSDQGYTSDPFESRRSRKLMRGTQTRTAEKLSSTIILADLPLHSDTHQRCNTCVTHHYKSNSFLPKKINQSFIRQEISKIVSNWQLVPILPFQSQSRLNELLATTAPKANVTEWQANLRLLLLLCLTALCVGLVTSILTRWWIVRSINQLTQAIRAIAVGKGGQNVQIEADGSLRELSTAINAMVQQLQTDFSQEYQQAEEALRKNEAFRRLVEANLVGVGVAYCSGQVIEANDAYLNILGYTREDLQEGQIDWIQITPPEYRENIDRIIETLRTQGKTPPDSREYLRKDGSRIPVLVGNTLLDEDTQTFIGLVVDLTDRKKAEDASILAERNRMAREIHDTLAQAFTSILVHLDVASRNLTLDLEMVQRCLQTSYELAQSGLMEARQSLAALRPQSLEQGTLYKALYILATQMFTSSSTRLVFSGKGERYQLPQEIENQLLRIGQESLMNACKHAQASEVQVELQYDPTQCILRIKDDGVGFEPDTVSNRGYGFLGMTERAEQIGAQLRVNSVPGQGTEVTVIVRHVNS